MYPPEVQLDPDHVIEGRRINKTIVEFVLEIGILNPAESQS